MPLRAVAVDLHGTLVLPQPSVGAIYAEVGREHGIDVDAVALEASFGPAFVATRAEWPIPYGSNDHDALGFWRRVISEAFAAAGASALPSALPDALFYEFGRGARWRVLPNAREALAMIQAAGLPMSLCSNFDSRACAIVADHQLGPFEHQAISSQVGAAKPDPAMHQWLAERTGIALTDWLHIGDHPREDGGVCAASGATWLAVPRDGSGINLHQLAACLATNV